MSLRDKIATTRSKTHPDLFSLYGVLANPFPASSQTSNNPRKSQSADSAAESRIVSFIRDQKSQVVVVEGTQGVGKTNFLNHFEAEIEDVLSDLDGFYVVRYLADPEASFDGTIRRLFQELGEDHIQKLIHALEADAGAIDAARGQDMRSALQALAEDYSPELGRLFMDWLYGGRLLKAHKERLLVHFRLDTVESKTAALRDLVVVSSEAGVLNGIFLLLDELEKQDGMLSPTAVVRYLSAMRAIIDALPNHLFMMIAVTPDALRRYSNSLPAFRSRLQNQITLKPLVSVRDAQALANFYVDHAKKEASEARPGRKAGDRELLTQDDIRDVFEHLKLVAERRGDEGVPHRVFLHNLHSECEKTIQESL